VIIYTKGKYLCEEQSKEFLEIWNYQPVLTSGFKSKITKSEVLKDKFHITQKQLEEFHSNEVFKKIIHMFNQELNGYSVPLFTYNLKNKRHILLIDSKRFLKEGCIRNLKWAKTFARFDPKLAEEIQYLIDNL